MPLKGKGGPAEVRQGRPLGRSAEKARKTGAGPRSDGATDVNVPKNKPGNCTTDQMWMAAARAVGQLKVIEDDADVPFGVKLQWTGKAEDWGSSFQIPTLENRCAGRAYVRDEEGRRIIDTEGNILTRPCSKWRMRGSTVCTHHGGLTDGGIQAAKVRLAEAGDLAVGRLIKIIDNELTLDADRIRAINSLLDRVGVAGGQTVTIETPEWQRMLKDMWDDQGGPPEPEAAPAPAPAPAKRAARKAAKPTLRSV